MLREFSTGAGGWFDFWSTPCLHDFWSTPCLVLRYLFFIEPLCGVIFQANSACDSVGPSFGKGEPNWAWGLRSRLTLAWNNQSDKPRESSAIYAMSWMLLYRYLRPLLHFCIPTFPVELPFFVAINHQLPKPLTTEFRYATCPRTVEGIEDWQCRTDISCCVRGQHVLYNIYDHARFADRNTCQVVLGLFCGIAVFTVIVRLAIRIFTRSKLCLDDYLLLFGLACLGAATYLIYSFSRMIFLSDAIRLDPSFSPTFSEVTQLSGSRKIIYSFLATIWTTTFAVKLSFLVFFKKLIERVSKQINIYYWVIVVFTVVSWMFIVGEPFILCPYFGIKTREPLFSCSRYHGSKRVDVCP